MKKNHERSIQKTKTAASFVDSKTRDFFSMAFFLPRNIPGAAKDNPTCGVFRHENWRDDKIYR